MIICIITYLLVLYFLRVKKQLKMGIVEIGFYFLLEIQASFFQAYGFFKDLRFRKKIFFKFRFQVSQKNVQVVSLYTSFWGGFLLKAQKKCVYVITLFLVQVLLKICFFDVKKGYKQVIALGSCKTYCSNASNCKLWFVFVICCDSHYNIFSPVSFQVGAYFSFT